MDSSTISLDFGKQLISITQGTPYSIEEGGFVSELENRIRGVMYSVWMDANGEQGWPSTYRMNKQHTFPICTISAMVSHCTTTCSTIHHVQLNHLHSLSLMRRKHTPSAYSAYGFNTDDSRRYATKTE